MENTMTINEVLGWFEDKAAYYNEYRQLRSQQLVPLFVVDNDLIEIGEFASLLRREYEGNDDVTFSVKQADFIFLNYDCVVDSNGRTIAEYTFRRNIR
jgi:hypothetical protein